MCHVHDGCPTRAARSVGKTSFGQGCESCVVLHGNIWACCLVCWAVFFFGSPHKTGFPGCHFGAHAKAAINVRAQGKKWVVTAPRLTCYATVGGARVLGLCRLVLYCNLPSVLVF